MEQPPKNIQSIIDKLDEGWIDKPSKMWAEWEAMGRTELKKMGNKIIVLPAEENARWAGKVRPILDDYVKSVKAKGLPADEALKFSLDFLKVQRQIGDLHDRRTGAGQAPGYKGAKTLHDRPAKSV